MRMKKKTKDEQLDVIASFSLKKIISEKWKEILLFTVSILAVSVLNFFNIATSQTVSSFRLSDFEVGQIADRTIIANKSISADIENPVSIADGEKIIRKGFAISEEQFSKLKKLAESPESFDNRDFADMELFLILLAIIWLFLFMFVPFGRKIHISEIILQVVFFCIAFALAAFSQKIEFFSGPYSCMALLPSGLFVFLITILYGQLSAVIFSFICSLGVLCATRWEIHIFLFTLFSSLSAAWIVRKIEKRTDMVMASFILALLNYVFVVLIAVIFNDDILQILRSAIAVAMNGLISGIFALGLLTPLEYLLNTASVFRLMELGDLNAPEMKKMSLLASGTFAHSGMVAQLAENACRAIGANALLARVGAYYHDIGKIEQSEYFVENQENGVNKHDEINPSLSVAVIKSHLKKGVERAKQLHLPEPVINIIAEHHGNSVIAYFYMEAKEKDPSVRPEDFSYPGNPPSTRESGVVMLADTVEAACRTLKNPSVSRLEKFIQDLINGKIDHKQLDNCALTFGDIAKIKESFVQTLAAYYHSRIKYPDQKDPDEKSDKLEVKSEKSTNSDKYDEKNEKSENSDKSEIKIDKAKPKDKAEKVEKTDKSDVKSDKLEAESDKTETKPDVKDESADKDKKDGE